MAMAWFPLISLPLVTQAQSARWIIVLLALMLRWKVYCFNSQRLDLDSITHLSHCWQVWGKAKFLRKETQSNPKAFPFSHRFQLTQTSCSHDGDTWGLCFSHRWTKKLEFYCDCSLWTSEEFMWVQKKVGSCIYFGEILSKNNMFVCSWYIHSKLKGSAAVPPVLTPLPNCSNCSLRWKEENPLIPPKNIILEGEKRRHSQDDTSIGAVLRWWHNTPFTP